MGSNLITKKLAKAAQVVVETAEKMTNEGFKVERVDETTRLLRLAICEGCSQLDKKERACNKCGCPVDWKTALLNNPYIGIIKKEKVECPIKKW